METNELKLNPVATATNPLGKLEAYNVQITDFNGKTKYIVPLGVKRKKLRELFPNAKTEEITKHYDNHSCLIEVRFYLDRSDAADAFVANAHGASNTDLAQDYVTDALSKAYRRLYHNLGLTTLKEASSDLSDEKDIDMVITGMDTDGNGSNEPTPEAAPVPADSAPVRDEKPKRSRRNKQAEEKAETPAAETDIPTLEQMAAAAGTEVQPEPAADEEKEPPVPQADPAAESGAADNEYGMTLEEALQETISVYGEKGDRPLSAIFKDKDEVVGQLARKSLNKGFMNTLSPEEQRSYTACQVIMSAIKADPTLYDKLKGY